MADQKQYRILTPDGRLSHDTFVVPSEQPATIQANCLLLVNDSDGTQLTVHRDRLFAIADAGEATKVCLKCGRVLGVVEDQVQCPYDEDGLCNFLEPPDGLSATPDCAEHSL